ncbi:MAG: MATE family efflux transporter, partial [Clostridiales bacterium]|nr:MATE family efflux transporter [Clostridiales bacterium]
MNALIRRFFSAESLVPQHRRLGDLPGDRDGYRNISRIAIPSVSEMVLSSLIGSMDAMMVGILGKNAIAGVNLPTQPRMISLSLFFALNVGVTAIVARRKGEERREAA